MKGYLDNDKATVETIKKGWLHSGDIAYHDPDGNIFIVDRLKELIKVKGFQVSIIYTTVCKRGCVKLLFMNVVVIIQKFINDVQCADLLLLDHLSFDEFKFAQMHLVQFLFLAFW